MWKLTIEDDEGKQTSLPLAHDEYGVGRAEANAIRLTDRNVSRKHAVLRRNGQGWFVRDLSSYNGTYVNGARVAGEQLIHNGDVVQLGDYRLELIDEAAAQPQAPDDQGLGQLPVPVHHRPDRLVVVVGPTPGAEFPLDREYYTVGRAEDATISINHSSVSRLHAELISLGNGRYEIVDKQSANGIRINGVELKRGIMEAGDALELGDVRMRFVGAGKIFRANADHSQEIRTVGSFESVAASVRAVPVAPPRRSSSIGKFVAIGVVVGILAIAAVVFALRGVPVPNHETVPTPPPTATGTSAVDEAGNKLLAEARTLAQQGDLEGAHSKLTQVGESSPLREDPGFKEIEGKWADELFTRADAATDPVEKRKLLNLIASTPTVDRERRQRAADKLQDVEPPAPGEPPPTQPRFSGTGTPATGKQAGTAAPAPTTNPAAGSSGEATPGAGSDLSNQSIKKALYGRVQGGKASIDEIRMLKAACSQLGDRACRDMASSALQKKLGE
ncbi:MAG: FHA domain-containing protein [Polyangiaceae bacterium]